MRQPVNSTEREQRIEGKSPSELFPYFGATQQQGWIDDFLFDEELVLLGEDGVPFFDALRPKAYLISGKTWVNNHAHVFRGILISHAFLTYCLNTFDYKGRVAGATRSKLNQAKAVDIPIILPPLAEQHRIVARVDELMALCDRLEAAQEERERRRNRLVASSLNSLKNGVDADAFRDHARFYFKHLPRLTTKPEHIQQLRQTILNLAVRGKLVPQDSNEEQGSELLKRIYCTRKYLRKFASLDIDELESPLPEIPPSWTWTVVDQIAADDPNAITDGPFGANLKTEHYVTAPGYRVIRLQNIGRGIFREEHRSYIDRSRFGRLSKHHVHAGDLVVAGLVDPHVRCCRLPDNIGPAVVKADCYRFSVHAQTCAGFALHYLNSAVAQEFAAAHHHGMTLTRIGLGNFRQIPVPLPPFAEQQRIVAKVDELMALCDKIEAQLTTTHTDSRRLLEAVLHEALAPAVAS
ncbi:MAG: restriction endonuclease subunit S [Nitrospira sp.]|nr:restriction endonuclease subunit S [Nitrospira sp.]